MEKRKLLFVFLMLVIGGLFFNSCSKDDKSEEVNSLNGTIWEGKDLNSYAGEVIFDSTIYQKEDSYRLDIVHMKIRFNKSECIIYSSFQIPRSIIGFDDERSFEYSYKPTKYTLTPKNKDLSTNNDFFLKKRDSLYETLEATIFDNEMSILNTKTDEVFKLKRIH